MHSAIATAAKTTAIAIIATIAVAPAANAQAPATPAAGNTTATVTAVAPDVLSVPLPPYARLRVDMDARDEDMLGVIKSFFNGFDATGLRELLPPVSSPSNAPGARPGPPVNLDSAAALQLMSDANLSTILENINRIRLVAYEPRRTNANRNWEYRRSGKDQKEAIAFFEQKYIEREGGRRMLKADFDEMQMLMVAFPNNGFAVVVQSSDFGLVIRADGYPDFSGLGPLVMAAMVKFAPMMTGTTGTPYSSMNVPNSYPMVP